MRNLASLDLPHLNLVHLGPNDHLTDDCLSDLRKIEQLQYLGLAGCPGITDSGLGVIGEMKQLRGLDLRGNPQITDAGLSALYELTNLETFLLLDGCPNISSLGANRLQAALPDCRVRKNDRHWKRMLGLPVGDAEGEVVTAFSRKAGYSTEAPLYDPSDQVRHSPWWGLLFPVNVGRDIVSNTIVYAFNPLFALARGEEPSNLWGAIVLLSPILGPVSGILDAAAGYPFWDPVALDEHRAPPWN